VPVVPAPVVPALPVPTPAVAEVAAAVQPQVDAAAVNAAAATPVADAAADGTADDLAALPDLSGLTGRAQPATAKEPAGLLPTARGVLANPAARSLVAVLAIALGVLLFLAVQGRFDRGEPKLAGVRDGRDVARFR